MAYSFPKQDTNKARTPPPRPPPHPHDSWPPARLKPHWALGPCAQKPLRCMSRHAAKAGSKTSGDGQAPNAQSQLNRKSGATDAKAHAWSDMSKAGQLRLRSKKQTGTNTHEMLHVDTTHNSKAKQGPFPSSATKTHVSSSVRLGSARRVATRTEAQSLPGRFADAPMPTWVCNSAALLWSSCGSSRVVANLSLPKRGKRPGPRA